jgi:hypothetical protein
MSELIISIDSSEVREGKLEEVKTTFKELAEFVETNEPRPISYHVYFNESLVTVVQVHPDSASMENHMEVGGPIFRKFSGLLKLSMEDIYGTPSDELLDRLRKKAQMLGPATVNVHELHAGFARFAAG